MPALDGMPTNMLLTAELIMPKPGTASCLVLEEAMELPSETDVIAARIGWVLFSVPALPEASGLESTRAFLTSYLVAFASKLW